MQKIIDTVKEHPRGVATGEITLNSIPYYQCVRKWGGSKAVYGYGGSNTNGQSREQWSRTESMTQWHLENRANALKGSGRGDYPSSSSRS
eukprot:7036349-Karenia_brevis.AAC.1